MSTKTADATVDKVSALWKVRDLVEVAGVKFTDIMWDMEHNRPAIKVESLTFDTINELNKVGLICSVFTGFGPPGGKVWYRFSAPYLLVERIVSNA